MFIEKTSTEENPHNMLHAGLDSVAESSTAGCSAMTESISISSPSPPDPDSLRQFTRRIEEVHRQPVCAVIESMTGARIVHDILEATTPCATPPTRSATSQQAPAGPTARAKVAQVDIARNLTVAIWHMLPLNESFAPRGAAFRLAA